MPIQYSTVATNTYIWKRVRFWRAVAIFVYVIWNKSDKKIYFRALQLELVSCLFIHCFNHHGEYKTNPVIKIHRNICCEKPLQLLWDVIYCNTGDVYCAHTLLLLKWMRLILCRLPKALVHRVPCRENGSSTLLRYQPDPAQPTTDQ